MKFDLKYLLLISLIVSGFATAAVVSNSSTLAGIDVDQDGVRDDVYESYIENYENSKAKQVATDYAKSFQEIMKLDVKNLEAVKYAKEKINRSSGCVYVVFADPKLGKHPARVLTEIKNATLDNGNRLQAFYRFNKALESVKIDSSSKLNC